jgi:hypothetical protein
MVWCWFTAHITMSRNCRYRESTPDSTSPNAPALTPCSKQYGSGKARSRAVQVRAQAQMERELILERTRAGLEAARLQGRVGAGNAG